MNRRNMLYFGAAVALAPSSLRANTTTPTAGTVPQKTLGGNGLEVIAIPSEEDVVLVSHGPLQHGTIPVIVYNGTDKPASDIQVKADVSDAAGKLIGVGEIPGSHIIKPPTVKPKEFAIGFILIQGDFPPDLSFEFVVSYEPGDDPRRTSVEFTSTEWLGDRLVGVLRNPGPDSISIVYAQLMCVGPDGVPVSNEPYNINAELGPGEETTFQIGERQPEISETGYYLVAGYGS